MLFRTFHVFINYSLSQNCRCLRIFPCNIRSSAGTSWHRCICFHGARPVYKDLAHVSLVFLCFSVLLFCSQTFQYVQLYTGSCAESGDEHWGTRTVQSLWALLSLFPLQDQLFFLYVLLLTVTCVCFFSLLYLFGVCILNSQVPLSTCLQSLSS